MHEFNDVSKEILSEVTVHMKYAKYKAENKRREDWKELIDRNKEMHIKKFPQLKDEIEEAYTFVYDKKILPSMRSLQFAGKPIEINPSRLYNCFTRDTKFITTKGVKSFEDFNDGDIIEVYSHTGNIRKARVKYYGKQNVDSIYFNRTKSNKVVRATGNHTWILKDGSRVTNLKEKDILYGAPKLFDTFDFNNASPFEKLYWCYGYVFGDGTLVKDGSEYKYSMVRLCGKDAIKYENRFIEMGFSTSSSLSLNGDIIICTGKYQKTSPDFNKDSINLIRAFLCGYLDADGYKNSDWHLNNELCRYKSIQSSQLDHIQFLELALETCGFYNLTKRDLTGEKTNFGIRGETYSYTLTNKIGSKTGPNSYWSVKKIEKNTSYEDVWCLEVEEDHSFILSGGIVTGNCSYLAIDSVVAFSETMFLLLGGTGVGYSVQKHHIDKLPLLRGDIKVKGNTRKKRFLISDSIEGWADTIKVLMESYFEGKKEIEFDYRDIRPKGARLVTAGGKAPGPQPLKDCVHNIRKVLDKAIEDRGVNTKLKPIEAHDIQCFIADAVLSGGIRRAAMISLFNFDDEEMLECKYGNWYELNPQRGRANNSVVIVRHKIVEEDFLNIFKKIEKSHSGEPGIYITNDAEWGTNPCVEISLRSNQFCNVVTMNGGTVKDQEDFNRRCKSASLIATLQASYTDFHYLRDIWKEVTEKEALIGVSITGIANNVFMHTIKLKEGAEIVKKENERVAKLIGINKSARCTTIKPEGTSSLVLGTSSGIHAWHNDYYYRRIRVGKNEAIYTYLLINNPTLLEDDEMLKDTAIIKFPIKAPEGAITRNEPALQLLERMKFVHEQWIKPGHRKGSNMHNVSLTVNVREDEWVEVGNWMWENKDYYNGISVLPYDNSSYIQMPFEDCTKEQYEELYAY